MYITYIGRDNIHCIILTTAELDICHFKGKLKHLKNVKYKWLILECISTYL